MIRERKGSGCRLSLKIFKVAGTIGRQKPVTLYTKQPRQNTGRHEKSSDAIKYHEKHANPHCRPLTGAIRNYQVNIANIYNNELITNSHWLPGAPWAMKKADLCAFGSGHNPVPSTCAGAL
jgi:hypothetical protein